MAKKAFAKKGARKSGISNKLTGDSYITQSSRNAVRDLNLSRLTVLPELESYIASLSQEEFGLLEANILNTKKVRDPLLVWAKTEDTYVIIDGHHRFKVIKSYPEEDIEFEVKRADVNSLDEAKALMEEIQLGRRNATRNYISYLRGRAYLREKSHHGGAREDSSGMKTRDVVAERFKVGSRTIALDAKFAEGVDRFADISLSEELQKERQRILLQDSVLTKNDVIYLFDHPSIELHSYMHFISKGGHLKLVKDLPADEANEFLQNFTNLGSKPSSKPTSKKDVPSGIIQNKPLFKSSKTEEKLIRDIAQNGSSEEREQAVQEIHSQIETMKKWLGLFG